MIGNCTHNCRLIISKHAVKIPPPKRDFQDPNPPKSLTELYARYDPSIGAGIAITLGAFLFYLLGSVALRWTWKRIKSHLQKSKRLARYFPAKELPPLHIAERIAKEQGIVIPDSLLIKLTARGDAITASTVQTSLAQRRVSIDRKRNFRRQSEARRLSRQISMTSSSDKNDSKNKSSIKKVSIIKEAIFPANVYHDVPITVNIIGATPSLTPNCSDKKKLCHNAAACNDDSVDYIDDNHTSSSDDAINEALIDKNCCAHYANTNSTCKEDKSLI